MKKINIFFLIFYMLTVVSCSTASSEKSKLQGEWTNGKNTVIEFFNDNTWVEKTGWGLSGKYAVIGDGRIKMETIVGGTQDTYLGELSGENLIFLKKQGFIYGTFYHVNNTFYKEVRERGRKLNAAEKKEMISAIEGLTGERKLEMVNSYVAHLEREKSYSGCRQCESDADKIASAIADFYANPHNMRMVKKEDLNINISNPYTISGDDPNKSIIIQVHDKARTCPADYQNRDPNWENGTYTKRLG